METTLLQKLKYVAGLANQGYWDDVLAELRATPGLAVARDDMGDSLLIRLAGIAGSAEVLKELIARGADVNLLGADGGNAVAAAIEGGSTFGLTTLPELKVLLESGANTSVPVESGYPPLHWAIVLNRLEHAAMFLDFGADPYQRTKDVEPETAFDVARRIDNRRALQLLDSKKKEE